MIHPGSGSSSSSGHLEVLTSVSPMQALNSSCLSLSLSLLTAAVSRHLRGVRLSIRLHLHQSPGAAGEIPHERAPQDL